MNYIIKNKIILLLVASSSIFIAAFGLSPTIAYAQNLIVDFEAEPLFSEANFLPGNEVLRTVEVTNNTEEDQDVIVEAINAVDSDGLGDVLNLIIKEGETTLYEDTLGEFLRAGEVSLSALGASGSTIFSFGVTFESDADNETQSTNLGFDLCVGFEGGESHCGGTVVGGEGDTDGGGPSGGGGSSGGGGGSPVDLIYLEVFSEEVTETNTDSVTAVIEWESNLLSTSQVIYGKEADGPYSLNLTVNPYFGYPFGTVEDPTKVTHHSVLLTGLEVGEIYVYRVVSRASPPTVGFQYKFALNEDGEVANPNVVDIPTENGTSGGETTETGIGFEVVESTGEGIDGIIVSIEEPTEEGVDPVVISTDSSSNNIQAAALGFIILPDNMYDFFKCLGLFLLFIVLIYIAWVFAGNRDRKEKSSKRRNIFFITGSIISIFISYLLGMYCTIIPLLILLIILTALYLINLFKNKNT